MAMVKNVPDERCVIDSKRIPLDRLRKGSVTCSAECQKQHKSNHYIMRSLFECAFCGRPSTPAERAAFKRFRNFEAKFPQLLYPTQFKAWVAEGGTLEEFIAVVQEGELIPHDKRTLEVKALHEEVSADAIQDASK